MEENIKGERPVRKGKTATEFGRGGELNTIIGKGTGIQGDVKVQNSLRIDGRVTGNVESTDTVIIGKDGVVEGKVIAKHVLLAGKIKGNINAKGRVFLELTASIDGDIVASHLVIDEGAQFNGNCNMSQSGNSLKAKQDEPKE